MKLALSLCLIFVICVSSICVADSSCLIVRSGQSHKARNAILAGTFTLGLAAAPAAIMSGTSYERVDGFGQLVFKQKYSGKDLKRLDARGVHIVVVAKDADVVNPRGLCGYDVNQGPMMSPQAQGWIQPTQPQPTQARDIQADRRCIATQIAKDGTETCTAWSPR